MRLWLNLGRFTTDYKSTRSLLVASSDDLLPCCTLIFAPGENSIIAPLCMGIPGTTGLSAAMRFLTAFLIAALPFVLSVLAHPGKHSPRSGSLAIPITRHNKLRSEDGTVNTQALRANTQQSGM